MILDIILSTIGLSLEAIVVTSLGRISLLAYFFTLSPEPYSILTWAPLGIPLSFIIYTTYVCHFSGEHSATTHISPWPEYVCINIHCSSLFFGRNLDHRCPSNSYYRHVVRAGGVIYHVLLCFMRLFVGLIALTNC